MRRHDARHTVPRHLELLAQAMPARAERMTAFQRGDWLKHHIEAGDHRALSLGDLHHKLRTK